MLSEIAAYIESCCNKNEILRNIKPQFIYSIVILKTTSIGEQLYKKIIEIEENEYFCKKYVFYYNDDEVNIFEAWAKKNKKYSFNELIRIESIWINNFKFVEYSENELGVEINFKEANLVLLNGPNGYGKTTTFEAVELLLTGDIKSFNSTLLNRGNISKSILANNPSKDIKITAKLVNEKGNIITIERCIDCKYGCTSTKKVNEEECTEEYLWQLLKFNKSIFDIGMYISQKESLEFLEKKYGDRKSLILGILDSSNIQEKSEFLKDFEKKVKSSIENNLRAIYYADEIEKIKPKVDILNNIKNVDNMLKERKYSDAIAVGKLVGISIESITEIEISLRRYNKLLTDLKSNERYRATFITNRKNLIGFFNKNIKNNNFDKNVCPLCGNTSMELERLFNMTERVLKENNTLLEKDVDLIKDKIEKYFDEAECINEKAKFLNNTEYKLYLELEKLININISNLTEEKEVMTELKFNNEKDFASENFDNEYSLFKLNIEKEINRLGERLSEKEVKDYENLIDKYYKNGINHKEVDINNKIAFIADKYSTGYSKQISIEKKKLQDRNIEYEKVKNQNKLAEDTVKEYRKKYDAAFKAYQTNLVENIKIPLYITSGKIIQNYPMGLGINVDIKDKQVIFQTDNKEDDIFNYLSMGQLNGVALSIMLSIRSTIDFNDGLDLILIDDPLQSIDDISAFSFADVLVDSFTDSQVIMSTHESDKSDLLEYKYRQYNKSVKVLNMYERYINS
ncbi:ABC-three component system middle component 1 [Clostridium chauvoei]|uniref:ABC-three component system middle component 1 n=2 Tax=Clostridium chauvoei TaxID=46867 RepID=UPI0027E35AC6|nr:ABC-three component system middle component 1 [Clostridium chauvoei]